MARNFTGGKTKEEDPKNYVFTMVEDVGDVPNSDLCIELGHYGNFKDYYYIFRKATTKDGTARKYKEAKFSADDMNALAAFLAG